MRALLVVFLCLISAQAAAFSSAPYFPLPDGAQWTYSVSGGGTEVRTVVGTTVFNGSSVRVIRDQTGSETYFTNDASGIRYHGGFFVDPVNGNETDTYIPPIVLAAREVSIGTAVSGSGTVYAQVGGTTYPVGYTYVSMPLAFETVVVPAGTFTNALHIRLTVDYPGFYTETIDVWLVPGIGSVKETNYDTFTGETAIWELVSYSVPDMVPDPFAFAPKTVDASGIAVVSDPITVSGISAAAPISISGGEYQINGGAFVVAAGTVSNGDQVAVRVYSPQPGFSASATLDIGGVTAAFTVTTRGDTAPDAFSFSPVTGAPLGITLNSNRVTVTGINAPAPISIAGGEYSVSGQPFTSAPGTVANFGSVEVRLASAASHGATTRATVTIGGISADFSVTTLAPGQGPSSALFYASQPGDYIGGGRTRLINLGAAHPGTVLEVSRNSSGGVTIYVSEPGGWYYLDLDAPGSGALAPGRYEGAVRYPFNGDGAGLSFTATGAGCNTVTGRFDVLEIAYAADGGVQRLAANFEQHCEGFAPALFGQMRVNSTVPLGSNAIRRTRADFNGDARADILWRNEGAGGTGENYLWPMDGTTIAPGEGYLRTVTDLDWKVVGIGDFDGDSRADILWRNFRTGENYIYLMNGTQIIAEGYLRTVASLVWAVAAVGDFDGDGKDDIFWRNNATGENYVYPMDGLAIKATEGYTRAVAPGNWVIVGVGDFDGDGRSDILWRNWDSGENYIYPMDGTSIKPSEGYIRTVPSLNWYVAGIGDLDGDGNADIVWRNWETGENYLYPMSGTTIKPAEGYLRTVDEGDWRIAAVGDFDGDGKSDLFWRNFFSGENYLYPMDGTTIKPSEGYIRSVPVGGWVPMTSRGQASIAGP